MSEETPRQIRDKGEIEDRRRQKIKNLARDRHLRNRSCEGHAVVLDTLDGPTKRMSRRNGNATRFFYVLRFQSWVTGHG
jgi:hypothetical protein